MHFYDQTKIFILNFCIVTFNHVRLQARRSIYDLFSIMFIITNKKQRFLFPVALLSLYFYHK